MQYSCISKPEPTLPFNGTKITALISGTFFKESSDIHRVLSTSTITGSAPAQMIAFIVAIIVIFGTATLCPSLIPEAISAKYIAIVPFGTATAYFLST